jgi:negative regulator of sigma E activity
MKRWKVVAGAAALSASLSLASAAPNDEPADGLVFDAMTAPETISYVGTVQALNIGNQGTQAYEYRIEHRAPNLTERTYLSPPRLRGDEIVTRGRESSYIDMHRHRVYASQNPASDDQVARDDNYLLMRANYRAVKQSSETLDGRSVRDVALVNKYTSRVTMLVRVDEETKLVLDKQQFGSDGALVNEVRFEDVRFTADVPAADFSVPRAFASVAGPTYDVPSKDVSAVVRSAGFPARVPTFLPDGFAPVEGHLIDVKHLPTLHVLFSDGIRTVSLFESNANASLDLESMHPRVVTISGRDAHYVERGPDGLLVWTDGSLHFALLGALRLDELKRIAASMSS